MSFHNKVNWLAGLVANAVSSCIILSALKKLCDNAIMWWQVIRGFSLVMVLRQFIEPGRYLVELRFNSKADNGLIRRGFFEKYIAGIEPIKLENLVSKDLYFLCR